MREFSILIPTWNNLAYLKLCIGSIQKNSAFKNQIIVYVNEGNDGTADWLAAQGIEFIHSQSNVGICIAVNSCRSLVKTKYIVYMNDDMYVCPNWDAELYHEIQKAGGHDFMFSSTLIEPVDTGNPSYVSIVRNFGTDLKSFEETKLLQEFGALRKDDWSGASWPPSVVSVDVWDKVGGYSIEFSPGMYSDPDFAMKLWRLGIRLFKGVGSSRVYHFGSKSTKRMKKNTGGDTFLLKWGITARTFYSDYLKMGQSITDLSHKQSLPVLKVWRNKIKRIFKAAVVRI